MIPKALAEAAGTFTMIFLGAGSILLTERFPQTVPAFIVPLTWGIVIAGMIFAMGPISGAHFNPAVTLAFAAARRIPAGQIWIYWGSQFIGGLTAIGLLEAFKKI